MAFNLFFSRNVAYVYMNSCHLSLWSSPRTSGLHGSLSNQFDRKPNMLNSQKLGEIRKPDEKPLGIKIRSRPNSHILRLH